MIARLSHAGDDVAPPASSPTLRTCWNPLARCLRAHSPKRRRQNFGCMISGSFKSRASDHEWHASRHRLEVYLSSSVAIRFWAAGIS